MDPMIVDRRRLRERVEAVRPSILALFAPAGYGKTTFLRQAFRAADTLVCDCDGLRDGMDLARRLLPDLESVFTDGGRTVAERLDLAVERFSKLSARTIVFERARLLGNPYGTLEFFTRLLSRRPDTATIVLASREPPAIRLTRLAPPHELLVLRAEDLAFDEDEIREMFAPYAIDTRGMRQIIRVSEGWPIVLFLLARFAREHRIGSLLDRLHDAAFVELHEYLTDEVLALVDDQTRQALFACAAVPRATDADIRDGFSGALEGEALAAFAKESPFLKRRADGSYRVPPIIASLLLEHQQERRGLILGQLALQRETEHDYIRAAELHLENGDAASCAAVLAQHNILRDLRLPERYFRVLSRLSSAYVERYPHLWGMAATLRLFREQAEPLLDEAQSVWRTIPHRLALRDRHPIFVMRVLLMAFCGRSQEALAEIDDMMVAANNTRFETNLRALQAFLRARSGSIIQAQADADEAMSVEGEHVASFLYMTLGAEIARQNGDRMESQLLERGLERAKNSGMTAACVFLQAQVLICAWLTGDDQRVATAAHELQAFVDAGFRGCAYLAAAALQREARPSVIDLPELAIYGHFIEIGHTRDERRRVQLARQAFAAARRLRHPFLEVLAALACALTEESQYDQYLSAATSAAAPIESVGLHAALEQFVARRSDLGMLAGFFSRIARDSSDLKSPIDVSFANAAVRVDGVSVEIGGRELELLLALALRREPSSRARLASMLWPDVGEDAARNAFSVCLHRLRVRLARKGAIERDGDGYRLHSQATVDLWELERVATRPRVKGALSERERGALERLWRQVGGELPNQTEQWEWFEPVARRLRESRVILAHALGEDAVARNDTAAAVAFSDDVLRADPCDEQAAEIGIRAHLLAGDRAEAMRRYRQYRAALNAELGAEPSFSLTALVTTA